MMYYNLFTFVWIWWEFSIWFEALDQACVTKWPLAHIRPEGFSKLQTIQLSRTLFKKVMITAPSQSYSNIQAALGNYTHWQLYILPRGNSKPKEKKKKN